MHTKLETSIRQDFYIDRIVEIACGFRIDGDGVSFSEIVAAGKIFFGETIGEPRSFVFNFLVKDDRKTELVDDDIGFDIRIVNESNYRYNLARRPSGFTWKSRDLWGGRAWETVDGPAEFAEFAAIATRRVASPVPHASCS